MENTIIFKGITYKICCYILDYSNKYEHKYACHRLDRVNASVFSNFFNVDYEGELLTWESPNDGVNYKAEMNKIRLLHGQEPI